jgi:hypothetical protein
MEVEILLGAFLFSLFLATMIFALSIKNKDLEIQNENLKGKIELEQMRCELNLAKFQVPKK